MTSQIVYSSDRTFRLWRYNSGHSRLLLRSSRREIDLSKTVTYPTQQQILFKPVDRMHVAERLYGLTITDCTYDASARHDLGIDTNLGSRTLFRLDAHDFTGYVISGICAAQEDEFEELDWLSTFFDGRGGDPGSQKLFVYPPGLTGYYPLLEVARQALARWRPDDATPPTPDDVEILRRALLSEVSSWLDGDAEQAVQGVTKRIGNANRVVLIRKTEEVLAEVEALLASL